MTPSLQRGKQHKPESGVRHETIFFVLWDVRFLFYPSRAAQFFNSWLPLHLLTAHKTFHFMLVLLLYHLYYIVLMVFYFFVIFLHQNSFKASNFL